MMSDTPTKPDAPLLERLRAEYEWRCVPPTHPDFVEEAASAAVIAQAIAEIERLRTALRFYARGHHFDLEDWEAPDEPNWLCPPSEIEVEEPLPPGLWGPNAPEPKKHKGHFAPSWMVEDGGIAESALYGKEIDWEDEPPAPLEGEGDGTAVHSQSSQPCAFNGGTCALVLCKMRGECVARAADSAVPVERNSDA